jgi:valyl-tRNA synthetase
MTDRLKPEILRHLETKLGKTAAQIRPRISEIRRKNSGLSMNAAAQVYAEKHKTSVLGKLSQEDRSSLASYQSITQVNVSSVSRIDRRTVNITNSSIHNLSIGDRNQLTQEVKMLDDALNELLVKIQDSTRLTSDEKNDYKSDIETIATQAGKSSPNRKIIHAAWESIKTLSTIEGFAQFIARVGPFISNFLPQ